MSAIAPDAQDPWPTVRDVLSFLGCWTLVSVVLGLVIGWAIRKLRGEDEGGNRWASQLWSCA